MKRSTFALFAAGLMAVAAAPAGAATLWALDSAGGLARIDSDSRKAMPAMMVKGADGKEREVKSRGLSAGDYSGIIRQNNGSLTTILAGIPNEVSRKINVASLFL